MTGLAATAVVAVVGVAGLVGFVALFADSTKDAVQTSVEAPAAGAEATAGATTGEEDAATEDSGDVGADAGDGIHEFGRTVTLEDGSTLTVAAPVRFTREDYAAGGEGYEYHVKFKATFVNKASGAFDPSATTSSVASGGREGDSVFQDGLDTPDSDVLPGKKITWWMGYGVDDPDDVQLTVALGFLDYEDVIFTT